MEDITFTSCTFALHFCVGELRNYLVEALLPPLSSAALCADMGSVPKGNSLKRTITCQPGTIGRLVRIKIPELSQLVLCEVEVYGGKNQFNVKDNKIAVFWTCLKYTFYDRWASELKYLCYV